MIPVVTPAQMAAIDAAAPEPAEVLIERAGAAVARAALEMMGGRYGRRVAVLAGKGNNGADGRAAARRLRRAGVRVSVSSATEAPDVLGPADLYVDAAFGTGLSRPWQAPARARPDAPVLAVDIPSGLSGLDGSVLGGPVWPADRTVTFAALKPGLLLGDGPRLCGEVTVADIGLSVEGAFESEPRCDLITDDDIEPLPAGAGSTHKWQAGVLVVAGSPGMEGAAALTCAAALRSGARIVHLSAPAGASSPVEVVRSPLPARAAAGRFKACAVGPGLGRDRQAILRLRDALGLGLPTVIDADALRLLRRPQISLPLQRRRSRSIPTVLTPHAGELRALLDDIPSGAGPIAAARTLARRFHAVALLKGGPTVVASPGGRVVLVSSGDARLATAGSGDVLTGIIAGRLAAFDVGAEGGAHVGVDDGADVGPEDGADDRAGRRRSLRRAAEAAHLHGRAAAAAGGRRLVAGDLIDCLRTVTG